MKRLLPVLLALPALVFADPDVTFSGTYTADQEVAASSDTTIHLAGATFDECRLKLSGNVTFTLDLVSGTENVFNRTLANDYCIKATKNSNLVLTGGGSLSVYGKKKLDPLDKEGLVTCNDLTVAGGDVHVAFDNDKSDTPCIFLKGNYLQTGGTLKVEASKKNCTNEFAGVHFDTAGTSFTLQDGVFKAEMAGTRSRAIDLKKSCTAVFRGGSCRMQFEGPQGRFVSGGTLRFEGGDFRFATNVTAKMTAEFMPHTLSAVKADYSIAISGGTFTADIPLVGSEVFTTDSATGTSIDISGGVFDLVAGDDCISANGDITVSGGVIRGVSVHDDVLDANGDMAITGGFVQAWATGFETHGLDVNRGHGLTISGGVVVATDGVDAIPIGTAGSSQVGATDFRQPTCYQSLATADYSGKYIAVAGVTNGVPFALTPRLPEFASGRTFNLLVSVPGGTAAVPPPLDAPGPDEPAPVAIGSISVTGDVVEIGVQTVAGTRYVLQRSTDLVTWTPVGDPVDGTGGARVLSAPKSAPTCFFRVTTR